MNLAEAYCVIVPRPPTTIGNRSPGRLSSQIDFAESAADWLVPLLERYDSERRHRLVTPYSPYLLVPSNRVHDTAPVSASFVKDTVRRVSAQAIGSKCSPNTLRKTAASLYVRYVRRNDPAVLPIMGWHLRSPWKYVGSPIYVPLHALGQETDRNGVDYAQIDFPSPLSSPTYQDL